MSSTKKSIHVKMACDKPLEYGLICMALGLAVGIILCLIVNKMKNKGLGGAGYFKFKSNGLYLTFVAPIAPTSDGTLLITAAKSASTPQFIVNKFGYILTADNLNIILDDQGTATPPTLQITAIKSLPVADQTAITTGSYIRCATYNSASNYISTRYGLLDDNATCDLTTATSSVQLVKA